MLISSLYDPPCYFSVSICSPNAFKGLTTLSSQTYGAWVSLWWRWPSDASQSHHLIPRSWSKSLVSPSRGTPPPARPPLNPGPLVDPAAVSDCLPSCLQEHDQLCSRCKLLQENTVILFYVCLFSIRSRQQTSHGYIRAA